MHTGFVDDAVHGIQYPCSVAVSRIQNPNSSHTHTYTCTHTVVHTHAHTHTHTHSYTLSTYSTARRPPISLAYRQAFPRYSHSLSPPTTPTHARTHTHTHTTPTHAHTHARACTHTHNTHSRYWTLGPSWAVPAPPWAPRMTMPPVPPMHTHAAHTIPSIPRCRYWSMGPEQ